MSEDRIEIHPVGDMVLICHDEEQGKTPGGLILPDNAKITTLTGRIIRIPQKMQDDQLEYPFRELDRVIYDIRERIPCELVPGNKMFLADYKSILAVVRSIPETKKEER